MVENPEKLWLPHSTMGATLDEVVSAYATILDVRFPTHHRLFMRRQASSPESAQAEAAVFGWLQQKHLNPDIAENPGTGGVDFLCRPPFDGQEFIVEATSLDSDSVSHASKWSNVLDDHARSFGMITKKLWEKTRGKARQLSNHECPRLLVICLSHIGSSALLGPIAAEWMMTSETQIGVAIDRSMTDAKHITDLRQSAFFGPRDGDIVALRRSISAVMLMGVEPEGTQVVGLLHPKPAVTFDYRVMPEVPFLMAEWPIRDGNLRTNWVVGHPNPQCEAYLPPQLSTHDLKGEAPTGGGG